MRKESGPKAALTACLVTRHLKNNHLQDGETHGMVKKEDDLRPKVQLSLPPPCLPDPGNEHMTGPFNVVVTCTQRKRVPVPPGFNVGSLSARSLEDKIQEWINRLRVSSEQKFPAHDLYAGDAWTVIKDLVASPSLRLEWWICSAGYGLVKMNTPLTPYAATFSSYEPDSIITTGNGPPLLQRQNWWRKISQWIPQSHEGPRTIADLAKEYPTGTILVAASATYVEALEQDIQEAVSLLGSEEKVSVLSAGCQKDGVLGRCLLPADARFQARVGGARQALNARLLRLILDKVPAPQTKAMISSFLKEEALLLPPLLRFNRESVSDQEVSEFIRSSLCSRPDSGHTPILRMLRDSGRSCEQARFRHLFHSVVHGSSVSEHE